MPGLTCQSGHADCFGASTTSYLLYAQCIEGMWRDVSTDTCSPLGGSGGQDGGAGAAGEGGEGGDVTPPGAGGEAASP